MKLNAKSALLTLAVLALTRSSAYANATAGKDIPWETPLQTLKNSLSGPVAASISIIAIVICGATLIWGGEIGDFARRLVYLVLVIALVVSANTLISGLFAASGALL